MVCEIMIEKALVPQTLIDRASLRDQFFDLRGLSAYSALCVSTLRTHIKSNGLPAYEVYGKTLVKKSEFDRWISAYRTKKEQDLNALADEVLKEIGCLVRRSKKVSSESS